MQARVVHVRRSLAWVKFPGEKNGQWVEGPPKRNSKRDLPMTETNYRALLRHMAHREQEAVTVKYWHDSGYLFTSVTGAPLNERNVTQAFRQLCDRAKVRRIRFHDMRHNCGTLLRVHGADPFIIQKVLGNSQLPTTNRYTQVPMEVTRTAVTGMESLINAAQEKEQKQQKETDNPEELKPVPSLNAPAALVN